MDNLPVENTQAENLPQSPTANKRLLVALAVLVVVLVFVGFLAYKGSTKSDTAMQKASNSAEQGSNSSNEPAQNEVNQAVDDTSDARIDEDLQTIDSGISVTETDSAAVDQGLNDKADDLQ
jgi:Flp pilus assembly protein TadB